MKKFVPDFPEMKLRDNIHTAFRLTLEDDPSLGTQPAINSFAANGNTSVEQLQDTISNTLNKRRLHLNQDPLLRNY